MEEYDTPIYHSFSNAVRSGRFDAKNPSLSNAPKTNKLLSISGISVGDIVKLRTGSAPIRVEEIGAYGTIRGTYTKSNKKVDWRNAADFELFEEENKVERFEMKNKLFVTRAEPFRYGKGVTEVDTGKYLLEMNDTKSYEAFNISDIKLVVPYSYAAVFHGMNGKEYQYRGKEGSVSVGDLLMDIKDFTLAKVVAVNTESELATKEFNGVKILTAPIA